MSLFRIVFNAATGASTEIPQALYQSPSGLVILDADETPPEGYVLLPALPAESANTLFQRQLGILNLEYQKDVDSLNKAFSLTLLLDGPTEETKKTTIRGQYATRKAQYLTAIADLRIQYGV